MATIVLNPEHGGSDPGAVEGIYHEANLNIAVAHRVKALLENYHNIIMTRVYGQKFEVPLQTRVDVADNNKADLMVTIAMNRVSIPTANGIETYYYKRPYNDRFLAECIHQKIVTYSGISGYIYQDRGYKQNNFTVVMKPKCPAILVECGFMSNQTELAWLTSPQGQITIGYAIAMGILQFIREGK